MKNKVSGSGDSIFKKKGFFIALYSCLGAVMVLALVISFTNLTQSPISNEQARGSDTADETVGVNTDDVQSYLEKEALGEQAWGRQTPKPAATATPKPAVTAAPKPAVTAPPAAPVVTPPPVSPSATPDVNTTPAATDAPASPTPTTTADPSQVQEDSAASNETAFTPFSEDDRMVWPVYGDIAMVFSTDKFIYDPTLDQYRINDDLRIAAQEGTPVKAGADGKVQTIGYNHTYGNYVEIDHGNGLVAMYGQLMDGVLVREGDVVQAGQVIGGVGRPSYFGSLNGTHLNLRVTKDDEPVDPRTLLADAQ